MRHSVVRRTTRAALAAAVGAVSMTALVPTRAWAAPQQVQVAAEERSAPKASDLFARPVTLKLERVALWKAVNALAESAGVRIQYRAELLEAVTKPVSISAVRVPLGTVLSDLLVGTGMYAAPFAENVVTIKPAAVVIADGAITGTVINAKTKAPVVGATILIDGATKGARSGDDGAFRIAAEPGEHTVHVRGIGFVTQNKQVTVTEGKTVTVDFSLEPSASVLNEVVVTGTVVATERKAIPTPITVIKAEDIEKRGITRVDQLLRGEIPGLLALDQGSMTYMGTSDGYNAALGGLQTSKVYSRGSASLDGSANPIKTYIDGVELLDPSYLGTIDPKSIERIEIITGPQAATIYGSGAMGGVMQIFTKRGTMNGAPDLTFSLRYGVLENNLSNGNTPTHNDGLSVMGSTGPNFSYSATLSYQYQGQWQPGVFARQYGGSVGATFTTGPVTASGSVTTTQGANGTFNSTYPGAMARAAEGITNLSSTTLVLGRKTSESSSQTLSFNLDYRMSSFWQHHATIGKSQTNFSNNPSQPLFGSPSDSMMRTGASTGSRTTLSYNTTVTPERFGVFSSVITLGANGSDGQQTRIDGSLVTKNATTYALPSISTLMDTRSWGAFTSVQLGVFDRVYLTLGLRGESNPAYGRNHAIDWTPTNGLTYTLEAGELTMKFLGSYGRATRPPNSSYRLPVQYTYPTYDPSQITYQLGAPNLTPEYSRGPQGGIELYYGNLGSLTVNRYQQTVTDLIQSVVVDSLLVNDLSAGTTFYFPQSQYQNVAKVRQQGWEGTASLNVWALQLKGTYSWNDSRVLSVNPTAYSTYTPGMAFRNLPTHTGNFTIGYATGGTSVTLVNNYVGSSTRTILPIFTLGVGSRLRMYVDRRATPETENSALGYVKSDLAVSQRLNGWASLTLNVQNLGNSYGTEQNNFYIPTLGRTTMFGVTLRKSAR